MADDGLATVLSGFTYDRDQRGPIFIEPAMHRLIKELEAQGGVMSVADAGNTSWKAGDEVAVVVKGSKAEKSRASSTEHAIFRCLVQRGNETYEMCLKLYLNRLEVPNGTTWTFLEPFTFDHLGSVMANNKKLAGMIQAVDLPGVRVVPHVLLRFMGCYFYFESFIDDFQRFWGHGEVNPTTRIATTNEQTLRTLQRDCLRQFRDAPADLQGGKDLQGTYTLADVEFLSTLPKFSDFTFERLFHACCSQFGNSLGDNRNPNGGCC